MRLFSTRQLIRSTCCVCDPAKRHSSPNLVSFIKATDTSGGSALWLERRSPAQELSLVRGPICK